MLLLYLTTGTKGRNVKYKFLMEDIAEDVRQQLAEVIGEDYLKDMLVTFGYYTSENEDRNCFSLLNGMRTEVYIANMMVADGDERDALCVYSPYRSRLDKNAKRGYAIFDTSKPFGRAEGQKNQSRTPNCPGCKLTIRDMKVSIIIKMFRAGKDLVSKKEEITKFISKIGKEAGEKYGVNIQEVKFMVEAKDYRI